VEIYLVGGAVRDRLLGRPVHDRDWVVVGATPEEMLSLGYKQVGADFPVFLHPQTHEEYALARTERKSGQGYHGFKVFSSPDVTLEQDLQRRDLTINAMAEAENGTLVDPFNGKQDLHQRILRHVSPAFAEDPLRILRVARFAARLAPAGFTVAAETLDLMRQMAQQGEAEHLVPERIWQETRRALHEQSPRTYFEVLLQSGALASVMPELYALFEPPVARPRSTGADSSKRGDMALRALTSASSLSDETSVRFAALAMALDPTALQAFCDRLKIPNDCRDLALLANRHHEDVAQAAARDAGALLSLLDQVDAWRRPDRLERLLQVCEAEGRVRTGADDFPSADVLRRALAAAQAVNARTFVDQGLTGKAVGKAIDEERLTRIQQLITTA